MRPGTRRSRGGDPAFSRATRGWAARAYAALGAGEDHGAPSPSIQSSELLGFPPDAQVLIVNCDDFGMHDAINAAVVDSIEKGIAISCSLMVPCPSAPHAPSEDRQHRPAKAPPFMATYP